MSELNIALQKFLLDTENPVLNYELGLEYDKIGQTASAITYYLRASERTSIIEHAYECLLLVGNCFNRQGNRANSVQKTYKQALTLLPNRPEAYLCLAKFFEINNGNSDSYVFADLGLKVANFNLPPLRTNVCNPLTDCYSGLLLEKAICSWGWGKNNETRELFSLLYNQHYDKFNVDYQKIIKNNMVKMKLLKGKIIDCFRFFNERELLELRYHLLKDGVDKFVILEGTKTHSGNSWQPLAKQYVTDLGFPLEKFEFIVVDLPGNDEEIENSEFDIIFRNLSGESRDTYKNSVNARTRERLTIDSFIKILPEYNDDDVFMVSDCDEIIKPEIIDHFSNMVRTYPDRLIKVPLVELQGTANLRLHHADSDQPVKTDNVFFICTKRHFERATPFQMRFNINNPYETVYVTQDGARIEDCGWHFSWMGDANRKKIKIKSTSHYADVMKSSVVENTDSQELQEYIENWKPEKNGLNPSGNTNYILKEYSVKNLPSIIFSNDRIYTYLLGKPTVEQSLFLIDKFSINSLDMKYSQKYLHERCIREPNFNGLSEDSGKEPYKLYSYIAEKINNSIILDIGSYLGNSAIALSKNRSNTVISYDIEDTGVKNIEKENIIWKIMNFMEDNIDYSNVKIILIDIEPHNGIEELKMIEFLKDIGWKGILLLDDIHLNKDMDNFWRSLEFKNKLDVTSVGHYTGTGMIIFK